MGFDNLKLAKQVSPTLISVDIPYKKTGDRVAVNLMLILSGKPMP